MLSGKQLRAYLAYAVHDRTSEPERKPPVKAKRSTPRRGPTRDEDYKAWIRQQPSLVSGKTPCDACHTGSDGGMSMKASDLSCVPLTRSEHQEYHRIGKAAFERQYGVCFAREVARLNAEWTILRKRTA
jgi:hypothetical protein